MIIKMVYKPTVFW